MLKYVPGEQKEGEVVMEDMPQDLDYIPFIITEELTYDEATDTVMDMLLADYKICVMLRAEGHVMDLLHKCVHYASNSLPLHVSTIDTTRHVEHTWIPVTGGLRPLLVQWVKRGQAVLLSRQPLPPDMPNVQSPRGKARDNAQGSTKKNRSNRKCSPNSRRSRNDYKTKDNQGYEDRRRKLSASTAWPAEHGTAEYSDYNHGAAEYSDCNYGGVDNSDYNHGGDVTPTAQNSRNVKANQRGGARPKQSILNGTSAAKSESSFPLQSHGSGNSGHLSGNNTNESPPLSSGDSVPGSQVSVSCNTKIKSSDVRLDNTAAHNRISSDSRHAGLHRRDDLQPTDAVRQRTPHYHHQNYDESHDIGYPDQRSGRGRGDRRRGGRANFKNTGTAGNRGRGKRGGRGSHHQRNYEYESGMRMSENKNARSSSSGGIGDSSQGVSVQCSPKDPSNNEPRSCDDSVKLNPIVKIVEHNISNLRSGSSAVKIAPTPASSTDRDSNDNRANQRGSGVNSCMGVPCIGSSSNVSNIQKEVGLVDRFQTFNTEDSVPGVKSPSVLSTATDTTERSDKGSDKPFSRSTDAGKESFAHESVGDSRQNDEGSAKAVKRNSRGRRKKRSSKSEEATFCNTDEISVC